MTEEEKYRRARQKVKRIKKFYTHLSTWMFTSLALMVLFFVLRLPPWITLVAVAGWGIGVAAEAIEVFGLPGVDHNWEERKIQEEMERMDHHREAHIPLEEKLDLEDRLELPDYEEIPRDWKDSDFV